MTCVGAGLVLLVFGLGRLVAVALAWPSGSPGALSILGFIDHEVAGLINIVVPGTVIVLAALACLGRSTARLALTVLAAPVLVWEMGRFFGPALHWRIFEPTPEFQQLAATSIVQLPGPPEWAVIPIAVMTAWSVIAVAQFWLGGANAWYENLSKP